MTCRVESGVTYKQEYNVENRIASIQKLASGTCTAPGNLAAKWDFTYDGDGTRTGQSYTPYTDGQPGTVEITRYYFGGAYETTGSAWKKYYSLGGATLMRDADGFKYFLSDHLGSTSVVLSAAGAILEQQRYLPFGEARVMPPYASVTSTDFTYTGQRNLAGTGLMDYKARFYSPALGRFIQPDTIIPGTANPQSWNRYSYVKNNPIEYNDPTGHKEQVDDGGTNINEYLNKHPCAKDKGLVLSICMTGLKTKPVKELPEVKKVAGGACLSESSLYMQSESCYRRVNVPVYLPRETEKLPSGSLSQNQLYKLLDKLGYENWILRKGLDVPLALSGKNFTPFSISDIPWKPIQDPAGTDQFSKNNIRSLIPQEIASHGSVTVSYLSETTYTYGYPASGPTQIPSGSITLAGSSNDGYVFSLSIVNFDATAVEDWFDATVGH